MTVGDGCSVATLHLPLLQLASSGRLCLSLVRVHSLPRRPSEELEWQFYQGVVVWRNVRHFWRKSEWHWNRKEMLLNSHSPTAHAPLSYVVIFGRIQNVGLYQSTCLMSSRFASASYVGACSLYRRPKHRDFKCSVIVHRPSYTCKWMLKTGKAIRWPAPSSM